MTVRLKVKYGKFEPNTNFTGSTAEEARLLATGQADTNTSSGVSYDAAALEFKDGAKWQTPVNLKMDAAGDTLFADNRPLSVQADASNSIINDGATLKDSVVRTVETGTGEQEILEAQEWVKARSAVGSIALSPGGSYTITDTMFLDNQRVNLYGQGATLQSTAFATLGKPILRAYNPQTLNDKFVGMRVIRDLKIKGSTSSRDGNEVGIFIDSPTAIEGGVDGSSVRMFIENVDISNCYKGISIKSQGYFTRMYGVEIYRCKFGLVQEPGAKDFAENVAMFGGTIFNCDCLVRTLEGQIMRFYGVSFDYPGDNTGARVTAEDGFFDLQSGANVYLFGCHVEGNYGSYAGQTNAPIRLIGANTKFFANGTRFANFGAQNPFWKNLISTNNNTQYVSLEDCVFDKFGMAPTPWNTMSAVTTAPGVMNVTVLGNASRPLTSGMYLTGPGLPAGLKIVSGPGGTGSYTLSDGALTFSSTSISAFLGDDPVTLVTRDDALIGGEVVDPEGTGSIAQINVRNLKPANLTNLTDVPSIPAIQGKLRNGVDDPWTELSWRIATTGTAAIASVTGLENSVAARGTSGSTQGAAKMMKITGSGSVIITLPNNDFTRRRAWSFFLNTSAVTAGTVDVKERVSTFQRKWNLQSPAYVNAVNTDNSIGGLDITGVAIGATYSQTEVQALRTITSTLKDRTEILADDVRALITELRNLQVNVDPRGSYAGSTYSVPVATANTWRRVSWKNIYTDTQINSRETGEVFCIEIVTTGMNGTLYLDDFAFDLM